MGDKAEVKPGITAGSEQSAEIKAAQEAALSEQSSRLSSTPDDDLPKVHSEADQ